jgi:Uma2 family endonuclease
MLFWLSEAFGKQFINPEAPIDVSPSDNSRNEPEPDLIVLKRPSTNFASGNPKPEDVALLVEIADSSLRFDLTVKAVLYARAGIADYWVLDVVAQQLYCHREPDGVRYQSVVVYGEGETVCPLAKPEAEFRVGIAFER